MNDYSTETLKYIIELVHEYHDPGGEPKAPPYEDYFNTSDIVDFINRIEFLGKPNTAIIVEGLEKLVAEKYLTKEVRPKGLGLEIWHVIKNN